MALIGSSESYQDDLLGQSQESGLSLRSKQNRNQISPRSHVLLLGTFDRQTERVNGEGKVGSPEPGNSGLAPILPPPCKLFDSPFSLGGFVPLFPHIVLG